MPCPSVPRPPLASSIESSFLPWSLKPSPVPPFSLGALPVLPLSPSPHPGVSYPSCFLWPGKPCPVLARCLLVSLRCRPFRGTLLTPCNVLSSLSHCRWGPHPSMYSPPRKPPLTSLPGSGAPTCKATTRSTFLFASQHLSLSEKPSCSLVFLPVVCAHHTVRCRVAESSCPFAFLSH